MAVILPTDKLFIDGEPVKMLRFNGETVWEQQDEAPGQMWTPDQLASAQLWWQAEDAENDGEMVYTWTDRIAGLQLARAGSTPLPTVSTLGTAPAVFFNGAVFGAYTGLAQTIYRAQRYGWIFAVYQREGKYDTYANVVAAQSPHLTTGTVTNLRLTLMDNQNNADNRPSMGGRARDLDSYARLIPAAELHGPIMSLITLDWAGNEAAVYANGAELIRDWPSGWNSGVTTSPDTDGYGIGVGGDPDTGQDVLWGRVASVVMGNGALPSQAEVDRLMGWAAHHYGQSALLPAGHPYKSAAP